MVFLSFFFWFSFLSVPSSSSVRDVLGMRRGDRREAVEECSCVDLFGWLPEHLLAVGVKPHVPEAHLLHEAL